MLKRQSCSALWHEQFFYGMTSLTPDFKLRAGGHCHMLCVTLSSVYHTLKLAVP